MAPSTTEKTPRHAGSVSNFDRAVARMQAKGMRPFCPDSATGATHRWMRDCDMPPEIAASAARIDALIAAFAIGALLGFLIGGAA